VDFPGSPALGDELSVGSRAWRWDGTGWARVLNAGQAASPFVKLGPFVSEIALFGNTSINNAQFVLINYLSFLTPGVGNITLTGRTPTRTP